MKKLLRRNSSTPLKRKGTVDSSAGNVQNIWKRVCIRGVNNISDEEDDKDEEEETKHTIKKRSKKNKLSKEEQALQVADQIRARAGLQRELLFRGDGKYSILNNNDLGTTEMAGMRTPSGEVVTTGQNTNESRTGETNLGPNPNDPRPDYMPTNNGPITNESRTGNTNSDLNTNESRNGYTPTNTGPNTNESRAYETNTGLNSNESRTGWLPTNKGPNVNESRTNTAPNTNESRNGYVPTNIETNTNELNEAQSNDNDVSSSGPFGQLTSSVHMEQPLFPSGQVVMGSQSDKRHWKKNNKRRRQQLQLDQPEPTQS